jgi:hypothetical protein
MDQLSYLLRLNKLILIAIYLLITASSQINIFGRARKINYHIRQNC